MQTITEGQEVWFQDYYGNVCSGMVKTIVDPSGAFVRVNGTKGTIGSYGVKASDCFETKESLLDSMRKKSADAIKAYCQQITDVNELVRFMYNNPATRCAGEYAEWDAIEAVRIRAKELLNIDLEG